MIMWKKYFTYYMIMKAKMNKSLHICYQNEDWLPDIYIKNWRAGCYISLKGDNRKRGLTDTIHDVTYFWHKDG